MAFTTSDLLRLPLLVFFDAIVANRINLWSFGFIAGYALSCIGLCISIGIFTCQPPIIIKFYRLTAAILVHCVVLGWNYSVTRLIHHDYYINNVYNNSAMSQINDYIWNGKELPFREVDFTAKALVCFGALQIFCWINLMLLERPISSSTMLITTCPAYALMLNISSHTLSFLIFLSSVPVFLICLEKLKEIYAGASHIRLPRFEGGQLNIDDAFTSINTTWVICRVPTVLRLYFVLKCVWAFVILSGTNRTFETEIYSGTKRSGLYYYFVPSPAVSKSSKEYWEDWDGIGGYFPQDLKERNLSLIEGMSALLTDSLISSFSVGAAISVIGHYSGVGLHDFVGGNDIMQGEALGMMSSVLFCLLAIQTGLSSLPPWKRIVRLYRNSFLLFTAVLHFFLDVVHPVLMSISPQAHIPFKKHIRPLLICLILFFVPSAMCYWLITTRPLSTWMIALTAFNFELVIKVISTLLVYSLYVLDSRSQTNGIIYLDEYVFWIRSISHVIEFICGLVMFINGAYILFFESSNLLRAIMMSMHAYINIYRTFREGLKTLNNRRTVNNKIASMSLVQVEEIEEKDRDVCSICYQEFIADNGEVRKTHCNHMFHSQCIRKWIFIQDSCPMCDRALFPTDNKQD
ncbi:E3 ubiquitin-protein ligase RNF139-like [Styela clava]